MRVRDLLFLSSLGQGEPDIILAQHREMQRQVPLLYALLTVNATAVSYTHFGLAPRFLTLIVPTLLIFACLIRFFVWRVRGNRSVTPDEALSHLRKAVLLGACLAAAYVSWSLALGTYGGPYEQGHVALFIAATVIGCIFCLMHLPQAAFVITIIVTLPYLVFYLSSGNHVFVAIALNIALVTIVMIRVLLNGFHGFATVVRSQTALAAKSAEAERLSAENLRLAHTDALTAIPNRRFFFSRLQSELETARKGKGAVLVGIIDLDRFKPINDTYGHMIGDKLLSEVGARLSAEAGRYTVVARLGGDEFGFIALNEASFTSVGQRICDALSQPYVIEGIELTIGCSCGMAAFPEAGSTTAELFDRSDYALYISKSLREGQAVVYSTEHERRVRSEKAVEHALKAANLFNELDIYLQPIINIKSNKISAVEALARWTSPVLGKVPPNIFIPCAERLGLIHDVTLALFKRALTHLEALPFEIKLSFNLSAHDVTSQRTIGGLISMIKELATDPSRIVFEITETAVMRDFDVAMQSINLLRRMGVQLALDDFGTGQSSLGYLHRLTIDKVKIDRSFVAGLGDLPGRKIIQSILGLCQTLDLECIVEGVEQTAQLEILQSMGCTTIQGFLIAPPMPVEEFCQWQHSSPLPDLGTNAASS